MSEADAEDLAPDGEPLDLGDVDAGRQLDVQGLGARVPLLDGAGVGGARVGHDPAGLDPLAEGLALEFNGKNP